MLKIEYVSESAAVITISIDNDHIVIDQHIFDEDDQNPPIHDGSRYYLDPLTHYVPL
jgi:hypothetical protein